MWLDGVMSKNDCRRRAPVRVVPCFFVLRLSEDRPLLPPIDVFEIHPLSTAVSGDGGLPDLLACLPPPHFSACQGTTTLSPDTLTALCRVYLGATRARTRGSRAMGEGRHDQAHAI